MTKAKETLLFLAHFNSWRRGNDDSSEQPDPSEVGVAIDVAVNLLRRYDELERENAALRADLLIEEDRSIYWRDNEAKAMAENASLRADKDRLDWLEASDFWPASLDFWPHHLPQVGGSLRAAIDAAMKEAQP